jgi:Flp pilus assembly protein TadG
MARHSTRFGDDRGSVLLLTAFAMIALLGMAALALDASYMYEKRNRLYAAADAAAKSGAIEVRRNNGISQTELETFAKAAVTRQGFTPDAGTNVVVHRPPTSGPYTTRANYVEVIVSELTNTFIGRVLSMASMTPTARAVAGSSSALECLITFEDLDLGVAHINMPSCAIASGGNVSVANGNAGITASDVAIGGTCSGTNCPANRTESVDTPPSDPLAGSLNASTAPTEPSSCTTINSTVNNVTIPLTAGCYNSITIGNNSTLLLGPGVYYVKGAISTGNSPHICLNVGCTFDYDNGVMIYLTGDGRVDLPNGTTMRLNAMTSGPYNGILFWQDASDANPSEFRNGSATYDLSGALYFPSADLTFGNGGGTNDCSLIVANNLDLGNGQNLFSNTCEHYGGSPLMTISLAE